MQAAGKTRPIWSFSTGCCRECRASNLPPSSRPPADAAAADHHPHRARRGKRALTRLVRPGPTIILSSLFPSRSFWRASAPSCAAPRRQKMADVLSIRRSRTGPGEKARRARPAAAIAAWPDGIPSARIPHGEPRTGILARAAARWRVGTRHLYRRAHGRRPHWPFAQRPQPRLRARPDPHGARRGLRAQ